MTDREAMKMALEALDNNRRNHYYCEDTWYSCPKHEDGCANDSEGNECNCGADKANQEIDSAITALCQALAPPEPEPEPEPVAYADALDLAKNGNWDTFICKHSSENHEGTRFKIPLYTTPPRKPWVGLTDDEIKKIVDLNTSDDGGFDIWCDGIAVARIVCAKLKEKNA